jgi:hypothetical protein
MVVLQKTHNWAYLCYLKLRRRFSQVASSSTGKEFCMQTNLLSPGGEGTGRRRRRKRKRGEEEG